MQLWERYHQLGQFVDVETGRLVVGGSTSAGLAPAGLALAAACCKEPRYLQTAKAIGEHYYNRFVRVGLTCGGPGDALQAPDSQSAAALLESFVTLADATREPVWIDRARAAAHLLASWVVSYEPRGVATGCAGKAAPAAGSVLMNANSHVRTPGYVLASGEALLRLYRATGDVSLLELLRDTVHNLARHLPATARDAPTAGGRSARASVIPMDGLFDSIGLLSYTEVPSIYVRSDTGFVFVFDHVTARITGRPPRSLTLSITNPTRSDAVVRVLCGIERNRRPSRCRHRRCCRARELAVAVPAGATISFDPDRPGRRKERPPLLRLPGARGRPSAGTAAANSTPPADMERGGGYGCRYGDGRRRAGRGGGGSPSWADGRSAMTRVAPLLVASAAIGALVTAARRISLVRCARAADAALDRQDRVLSALCLGDADSALARALVTDAAARAATLTPGRAVPARRPNGLPVLAAGALALAVAAVDARALARRAAGGGDADTRVDRRSRLRRWRSSATRRGRPRRQATSWATSGCRRWRRRCTRRCGGWRRASSSDGEALDALAALERQAAAAAAAAPREQEALRGVRAGADGRGSDARARARRCGRTPRRPKIGRARRWRPAPSRHPTETARALAAAARAVSAAAAAEAAAAGKERRAAAGARS